MGDIPEQIADLPCGGRQVQLRLTVRKFVCCTSACSQRIFTERLEELVLSYARMTTRLVALVQVLGLVAGGEQGSRMRQAHGGEQPAFYFAAAGHGASLCVGIEHSSAGGG